jgi:hypothetical protein
MSGVGQALRDQVRDPYFGRRERRPADLRAIAMGARYLPDTMSPQPFAGAEDVPLRPEPGVLTQRVRGQLPGRGLILVRCYQDRGILESLGYSTARPAVLA